MKTSIGKQIKIAENNIKNSCMTIGSLAHTYSFNTINEEGKELIKHLKKLSAIYKKISVD